MQRLGIMAIFALGAIPCMAGELQNEVHSKVLSEMRVKAAQILRDLKFLTVELTVTIPDDPNFRVRSIAKMAPGKLYTKLWVRDSSIDEFKEERFVWELLLRDGVVHEQRLFGKRDPLLATLALSYPSPPPYHDGTGNTYNIAGIENYMCLTASMTQTWIGPGTAMQEQIIPLFLDPKVSSLKVQFSHQVFENKDCLVVLRELPSYAAREDRLWWDWKTGFLIRWDTFYTDTGKSVLSRTRHYAYSISPIPAKTWDKHFESTLLPTPSESPPSGQEPAAAASVP